MKKRFASIILILCIIVLVALLSSCSKGSTPPEKENVQPIEEPIRYTPKEYTLTAQGETLVKAFSTENGATLLSFDNNSQYHVYSFDFETLSGSKYAEFSVPMLDTVSADEHGNIYGVYTNADATMQLISLKGDKLVSEPLALPKELENSYITRICILDNGARVVLTPDHIYTIDTAGKILADKGSYLGNSEIIRCQNGGFYLLFTEDESTTIEKLDESFELEATYEIPWVYEDYFEGPREHPELICAYSKGVMYLLNIKTGERTQYSNLFSSGGHTGGFICIDEQSYFSFYNNQPAVWTVASDDDVVVLSLATYSGNREQWDELLKTAVDSYNAQSSKYRVEIYDYATLNDSPDSDAGLTQFRLDIITGNTPDMYDLWSLPSPTFISSGLLENLYPYLNSMPDIQLIESVMQTLDCEGKLYELVPSFDIASIFCSSNIADEFENVDIQDLSENYPASLIFGKTISRNDFLLYLIVYSGKTFIDMGTSTCRLNSAEFINMLKYSSELSAKEDWTYAPDSAVFNGKQLIFISTTDDLVYEYQYANALFSGKAKLIGFPTNNGTGVSMAPRLRVGMSGTSGEKDGVWDFMAYLLGDSFQNKAGGIRVRRDLMEPIIRAQIDLYSESEKKLGINCYDDQGNVMLMEVPFQPLPADTEEEVWAYIDSIDGTNEYDDIIVGIIHQEAEKYYNGMCSPEEAAERMQNRVSVYLAEQS